MGLAVGGTKQAPGAEYRHEGLVWLWAGHEFVNASWRDGRCRLILARRLRTTRGTVPASRSNSSTGCFKAGLPREQIGCSISGPGPVRWHVALLDAVAWSLDSIHRARCSTKPSVWIEKPASASATSKPRRKKPV